MTTQWLPAMIPILVPLLIAGLKAALPSIPKPLLPVIAPILGGIADALLAWVAGSASNPVLGAALGSCGVGLREIYDQLSGNAARIKPLILVGCLLPTLWACASPIAGGMSAADTLEIMKAQNARGCIYARGSATPWASAGFLMVGTWGAEPPPYQDCWKALPLMP